MSTLQQMRKELMKAHQEGLADAVRLISDIEGAPKDATQIVICYLALEAARGSLSALSACEALREYNEEEKSLQKM